MSPGAVSHMRARATSDRSARPRTIICSTARLCDSATANMTFCNDERSIGPFGHARDTFVKQFVQILVHGDGLRKSRAGSDTDCSRGSALAAEVFTRLHPQAYTPTRTRSRRLSFYRSPPSDSITVSLQGLSDGRVDRVANPPRKSALP